MRTGALFLVCVVAFAGCSSNPTQPSPAACTFTLSATTVSIGAAGGTGSISVSTGSSCAWTARSDVSWITATSGTAVTGSGTFAFTVAAAPDASARTANVTVAGQTVSVSQQGVACTYAVSPTSASFGAAGGSTSFTVTTTSGCAWTAAATASWLSVTSGASGTGTGTVTYSVAANPDAASRTASVTAGGVAHTVTQAGLSTCTVTLARDDETFGVAGGTGTFDVAAASSCSWTVIANAPWISITDPAGGFATGSRRVSYSVAANTGDAARTGTMTVGGQTFVVTQAGAKACTYSVAPVEFSACFGGLHDVSVTVTADTGCGWTASPAVSWLTITSGASGYGTGSIVFNVGTNYEAPPRQGNIEVRWPTPTAGQNVRVSQSGCFYSIDRSTLSVPAAGGDYTMTVVGYSDNNACEGPLQDGCTWRAVSSASWVTLLNPGQHGGLDDLRIRVAANGTGSARTATITVRDKTLTITQSGT
jgi:hypothetical protein